MRCGVVADRQEGRPAVGQPEEPTWPAKAWFPNTSAVRVRFDKDMYVLVRNADGSSAVVYTGVVSRTDAEGNLPAFVALRVAPTPCRRGRDPRPRCGAAHRAQREGPVPSARRELLSGVAQVRPLRHAHRRVLHGQALCLSTEIE